MILGLGLGLQKASGGAGGGGGNPLPVDAATLFLALSNSPDGIDMDAGGNLWSAGANGNGLTKYTGFTNTVDITVDASGDYRGVAYDPVGDDIYGAEFDDLRIRVYAAADGATGSNYNTLAAPRDVCIFGGNLMVCSNDTLWVYTDLTTDTLLQTHTFASLGLANQNPAAMGTDGTNVIVGGSDGLCEIFTGASLLTATPVLLKSMTITDYEPGGFMHDGSNWYGCTRAGTNGVYKHANE